MAGNIVKWWKHKILGGYKQFSVLQECTTDSEELIYPVRAPSSCSAPPDLLMVSDRETVQLKQSINVITSAKGHHHHHNSHSNNNQQHEQYSHHSQNHHQQQQHHNHHHSQQQKDHHSKKAVLVNKNQESPLVDIESAELNGGGGVKTTGTDERIRLEEFTCDVSVESGKSSQPLQFSFTFYDLDGHHGKITKDDIAGIVYTIYESIGKSVVVPYCGSKTINVRLTVSPEAKTKPSTTAGNKLKKINGTAGGGDIGGGCVDGDVGNDVGGSAPPTTRHQSSSAARRQHRYRPRKLIKSDEDEDGVDSDSEKEVIKKVSSSNHTKPSLNHVESKPCCTVDDGTRQHSAHSSQHQQHPSTSCKFQPLNITENIYESVSNLKFNGREGSRKDDAVPECKECVQSTLTEAVQRHQQHHQAKHILTRTKLLRRTRKHKEQCVESRQRSLSVGNESSWKMRSGGHISKNNAATAVAAAAATAASVSTTSTTNATGALTIVDDVDGPNNHGSPNNECWNNALKRNDLIDIIRASMEKNRLCFQGSGKPHQQNGVSPIRHRHRSHTISKVVNDSNVADTYHQNHHQQQQPQQTSHHIPIYHQQMAINPALLTPHPKTNLCGYDSFLHATICTPSSASANNSPNSVPVPNQQQQQQQSPTTTVPPATKAFINNIKQQQQRSGKLSRNTATGGGVYHSQQSSPQFHGGYLVEPQKLNSSLLSALNPQITAERKLIRTIDNVEKWLNEKEHLKCSTAGLASKLDEGKLKKDEKNYDNLLYSKLNEKFLDVSTAAVVPSKKILNSNNNNNSSNNNNAGHQLSPHHHSHNSNATSNKENERHHHHSHHHNHGQRHSKYSMMAQNGSISPMNSLAGTSTSATSVVTATTAIERSKFLSLIPIDVDPIECENLIHPVTSDEDSTCSPPTPTKDNNVASKVSSGRGDCSAKSSSGPDRTGNGGSSCSSGGASNNGNNSISSTVHRYVHEHIHHHYHHFENKDD